MSSSLARIFAWAACAADFKKSKAAYKNSLRHHFFLPDCAAIAIARRSRFRAARRRGEKVTTMDANAPARQGERARPSKISPTVRLQISCVAWYSSHGIKVILVH